MSVGLGVHVRRPTFYTHWKFWPTLDEERELFSSLEAAWLEPYQERRAPIPQQHRQCECKARPRRDSLIARMDAHDAAVAAAMAARQMQAERQDEIISQALSGAMQLARVAREARLSKKRERQQRVQAERDARLSKSRERQMLLHRRAVGRMRRMMERVGESR